MVGRFACTDEILIMRPNPALEHLFHFKKDFAWDRKIMPENLGPAMMFLASPEAQYINGASLRIDDASILL